MKLSADLLSLGLKSLAAATVLFCLARIMGKKQISQLTYFDYVVGISIGSIAANLCLDRNISLFEGIVSMIVWSIFPLVLAFISAKSILGRKLLDGVSTILIQNGKILEKNLRKSKFTINDLLEELRKNNVNSEEEVLLGSCDQNKTMHIDLKHKDPNELNVFI